jgi:aspartyl/asparaginyl beta-hydroxylase (cupin superfamily)
MQTPMIDAYAVARSGVEALRRGDALKARELFERIFNTGQADASSCLGLAYACSRLNDKAATLVAVDRALTLEPRNLRALILKADLLAEQGDGRAACSFYSFALQVAPPEHELPSELRGELRRAQTTRDSYAAQFEAFLSNQLNTQGAFEPQATRRFAQSIDIMLGKRQIYVQQPRNYYFPELPQIQFYERAMFPWLDAVEAATFEIRTELLEVMKQPSAFTPYVESNPKRPRKEESGMTDNPDWSAFYLWKDGEIVPDNAARCPRTLAALAGAPLSHVRNRSPSILFSLLRPGARIPPHSGLVNTRLICHLPLIVPPDCGFRVGNETRVPVEGKAWVFDDTMEHEAWNRSDRARVILLFDVWRPELSEEERRLVAGMFEAIDAYGGESPAWGI